MPLMIWKPHGRNPRVARHVELGDNMEPAQEERHQGLTPGEIRLRRFMAVAGAAAVVIGLVVFLPRMLRDEPPPQWDQPGWAAPVFPFRPSWLPPGAPDQPSLFLGGPMLTVRYGFGGQVSLSAEVIAQKPNWDDGTPDSEQPGVVADRPATIRSTPDYVGVIWQLADGRWMQVSGNGPWTEEDVLRFARGLEPGSVPSGPPPFTFAEVPPGLTLQSQSPWSMCLAKPEQAATVTGPTGVCVNFVEKPTGAEPFPDPETVTVSGRSAQYQKYPLGSELRVDVGGGSIVSVFLDGSVRLGRDAILRFANGITYPER
jgi:hypothetical protein